MEEKATNKNWLAIASFVLAILWTLFCLSIVCLPLWVICLILAVIFGLIALCKRQKTRASILWILISLWVFIGGWMLWKKLSAPVVDFFNRVRENPAIWDMMSEKDFALKVKDNVTEKLQEKYGDSDDIKFFDVWSEAFEEAKQNILELAEQQWINGNEEPVVWIANPAAEFCVAQGWESYTVEDEDWAQKWMCRLPDGSEMDEWEYFDAIADTTSDVVEENIEENVEKNIEEVSEEVSEEVEVSEEITE